LRATTILLFPKTERSMTTETLPKVTLDTHAAFIARQVALKENRSVSNSVNTLLREAWAARQEAALKRVAPGMSRLAAPSAA
jgi:hypothetical protein